MWGSTYSFAMCVLEESQWLRTKSVTSPEFFHGTIELVEKGVCVALNMTEGQTRKLDQRVKDFVGQYTDDFTVFDTADYELPGISAVSYTHLDVYKRQVYECKWISDSKSHL